MKKWLNPTLNMFWCALCSPFVYYALKQEANAGDASYYWLAIVVLPLLVNRYYYIVIGTLLTIPVSSHLGQMRLSDTGIFNNFGPVGLVAVLAIGFGFLQMVLYALKSLAMRQLLKRRQASNDKVGNAGSDAESAKSG